MLTRIFPCLALICTLSVIGCGGEGDGKNEVSGTVTWNGSPLPNGEIMFVSTDGNMDGAEVVDGKFKVRLENGEKNVSVTAQKPTGMKSPDPRSDSDPQYQYLPEKFNTNTELKETISDSTTELTIALTGEEIPAPTGALGKPKKQSSGRR